MALRNPCFKDQSWSHLGENPQREREREREKEEQRREEEEEEEDGGAKIKPTRYGTGIFGMKTNLDYEFHENWHVSLGL